MSESKEETKPAEQIEVPIQPLHQGNLNNLHKQVFQARNVPKAGPSFASPTDNLMSPCTAKLQAHKKKYYTKGKPVSSLQASLLNAKENPKEA
ncbi:Spo12 family protein [Schizosaccharomyces japonicus yFS275]|uniref:Spo12 family protein n=1 Tax=Schizosaccharomyces japonicus (strain yFS275 / FY16936) TaxID=402676 RepID=B6K0E7_SCHJY|nr:Spo12 family protein [Schizosaccharomyces japonicus yFS275]EEB06297.1 Spo12 family protein [Schizosaccharomyces japonicus yFS275]